MCVRIRNFLLILLEITLQSLKHDRGKLKEKIVESISILGLEKISKIFFATMEESNPYKTLNFNGSKSI